MLRRKFALAVMLVVAGSLMLAGGAFARDRNHDRIPDRWEKRHHLSLHHKQGRRDQDHDGLKNRGEFRAHLNPRDADTDDDGIDDGDENAGTVDSFANDVLTIKLADGGNLSAMVDDNTEVKCDDDPADDRGHDEGDDGDHHGDGGPGDDDSGDDQGDDDGGDHGEDRQVADHHSSADDAEDCGTDALEPGTKVLEAELELQGGDAVWTEVELLSSDATP